VITSGQQPSAAARRAPGGFFFVLILGLPIFPVFIRQRDLRWAHQGRLVAPETDNHGIKKGIGIEIFKVESMTGLFRQQQEKRQLSAAVSFSEGMYGVQFSKEIARPASRSPSRRDPARNCLPLVSQIASLSMFSG